MTEWLQQWRERKFQINKDIDCDTGDMNDNDYICSESDSGAENKHEEAGLKNVLLVTGPVGVSTKFFLKEHTRCYEGWL